jgi:CubicO group peptidase (beta-lactamase class C family)
MRPGAIKAAAVQQVEGLDKADDYPRWVKLGLGWVIDNPSMGTPLGEDRFDHSVGHGGLNSCVGWMDINHKLGVAILTNGVREPLSNAKRLGGTLRCSKSMFQLDRSSSCPRATISKNCFPADERGFLGSQK